MRLNMLVFAAAFFMWTCCFGQDGSKRNHNEKAFVEYINDSIQVQVKLQYNEEGLPAHYYCHVNTPVCEQGLCRLMVLDVYWDVLGNFLKYELAPNESLTKFDHMEFTREDHEKLYGILSDKASVLRDYPVGDLIDSSTKRRSAVVDAVSAATRVEVKDAIVGGAVYSTYVLWHIVNGPIASRISEHTKPLFNGALLIKMFKSENFYYQYYALDHVPEREVTDYIPFLIHLVKNGISYIPYFAIEKIPVSAWRMDQNQISLLEHFGAADFELQNAMLAKITDVDLCIEALDQLIAGLGKITDQQMMKALAVIERNQDRISQRSQPKIAELSNHPDDQVAAQSRIILKNLNN